MVRIVAYGQPHLEDVDDDAVAVLKFSLCYVVKTDAGVAGGFDWKRITHKQTFALRAFPSVALLNKLSRDKSI